MPDTRQPSQRWKATPPATASQHPRGTQPPAGHASQRDSAGPPRPHTRAHSTWLADPDSPPRGQVAGGGRAPELRRPSQRRKATPPGTLSRRPHSVQQRLARAHAVGPVLGPHTHTNRARERRVAEPRLPAPRDRQLGEGERLTPDAPHNAGRPGPAGPAPTTPTARSPPQCMQAKGTVLGPHAGTPAHTARE